MLETYIQSIRFNYLLYLFIYSRNMRILDMILNTKIFAYYNQANPCFFITYNMCFPIKDGDFDTTIPAYSKALILLAASPLPFCTIAPA